MALATIPAKNSERFISSVLSCSAGGWAAPDLDLPGIDPVGLARAELEAMRAAAISRYVVVVGERDADQRAVEERHNETERDAQARPGDTES